MSYLGILPPGSIDWGQIGGTLSDQTDLQAELDTKPDIGQIVGRNKLINGNFRINRRGYVSGAATTGANQYTLDRWRVVVSGQSVTFTASGNGNIVTAPAGGYEQVIEGANIEGGIYTLSWTGTATATVNGSAITNGGQTTSLTANTNVTIRFINGTVSLAQFEYNSIATPFDSRSIALELQLCDRYCRVYGGSSLFEVIGVGTCNTTTSGQVPIPNIDMRTVPTLSVSANSDFAVTDSTGGQVVTTSLVVAGLASSHQTAQINITTASGLTPGIALRLVANNTLNARLTLDAEL